MLTFDHKAMICSVFYVKQRIRVIHSKFDRHMIERSKKVKKLSIFHTRGCIECEIIHNSHQTSCENLMYVTQNMCYLDIMDIIKQKPR